MKKTADLACLGMSEQELRAALPAFEETLKFFDLMQAADQDKAAFPEKIQAENISAFHQVVNAGCLRPDVAADSAALCKITEQFPQRDGSFIVIPNVRQQQD
ncbi:MAG: aspartyl/glutamyl-tRNA amidotransferase subunit C [Treponema sp.]|nr:aspartyl/glutamyl-tRNA amidotransferase subunit C [Treponema sp.]